jgi:hypothetical protein
MLGGPFTALAAMAAIYMIQGSVINASPPELLSEQIFNCGVCTTIETIKYDSPWKHGKSGLFLANLLDHLLLFR